MDGKVYAITGGASGMGLATARLLLSRGALVTIADVRQETLDTAVADLAGQYESKNVFAHTLDVTKAAEVASWLDETIQRFGRLDGAANLAGIAGKSGLSKGILDLDEDEWDSVINVNLKGVFNCLQAELQRMESNASVVNAASIAGLMGTQKGAAYSTSKASQNHHGVIGLTRCAAREAGGKGIRVNAIAPGAIETPMLAAIVAANPELWSKDSKTCLPAKTAQTSDVAKLIAFLLSDESSWITGTVMPIDGGYTA